MNRVLLSLGSNLDFRKQNIENCIQYLNESENINVLGISSLYETSPMYNLNQNDFINCVIDIETSLKSLALLEYTQSIEKKMGRNRFNERNQPRKIDIDILTYNDEIIDEKNLQVPHIGISERKFILIPLLELKGDIRISGYIKNVKELIKDLDGNSDKIRRCHYQINEKNIPYSS